MNNKTRIRLHLSKNLFESIAKEVLTEAKRANDGYTVAVKQPKGSKEKTPKAEGIHDHPSTGRITDNPQTNVKGTAGDYDPKARAANLAKLGTSGPKQSKDQAKAPEVQKTDAEATMGEMETKVAETAPVKEAADTVQTLVTMLATVLGVGGTIAASVLKDLKNAKTPEEKKQVLQSLASQITKSKGVDEVKEEE